MLAAAQEHHANPLVLVYLHTVLCYFMFIYRVVPEKTSEAKPTCWFPSGPRAILFPKAPHQRWHGWSGPSLALGRSVGCRAAQHRVVKHRRCCTGTCAANWLLLTVHSWPGYNVDSEKLLERTGTFLCLKNWFGGEFLFFSSQAGYPLAGATGSRCLSNQ